MDHDKAGMDHDRPRAGMVLSLTSNIPATLCLVLRVLVLLTLTLNLPLPCYLLVSFSAWAELVWRYFLEVPDTVTVFHARIVHIKTISPNPAPYS